MYRTQKQSRLRSRIVDHCDAPEIKRSDRFVLNCTETITALIDELIDEDVHDRRKYGTPFFS